MTSRETDDEDREPFGAARAFLALHAGPGFVLPNAWDAGSARILEQIGFPAIATTSAGIAWSLGLPDGGALDRDTMLEHVGRIASAVSAPVTADLESGYGDTPGEVGRTVTAAVQLGVVGANLEDAGPDGLFRVEDAVDRLTAAREAAPRGTFVLNARTDTYFAGTSADPFGETIERAVRYVEAGADCVFVPGVVEEATIRRLAAEIPAPLNLVAGLASVTDAPTLFSLGVRRVSVGGSLAQRHTAWWNGAGASCTTTGHSGFSRGSSATPTSSETSARDRQSQRRRRRSRHAGPVRRGRRVGACRHGGCRVRRRLPLRRTRAGQQIQSVARPGNHLRHGRDHHRCSPGDLWVHHDRRRSTPSTEDPASAEIDRRLTNPTRSWWPCW